MLNLMTTENSLWQGRSSQWLNLGPFSAASWVAAAAIVGGWIWHPAIAAASALPLAFALWKFLVVHSQIFELTSERLRITRGVINQQVDEIELYRIKDSQLLRAWWMRLVGLSSVSLETSDRTQHHLVIPAIPGGLEMRELLRQQVELIRDKKRVREIDFDEVPLGG